MTEKQVESPKPERCPACESTDRQFYRWPCDRVTAMGQNAHSWHTGVESKGMSAERELRAARERIAELEKK